MTKALHPQDISLLLENRKGPCISLYQPTHRHYPGNAQDPIRFKNLLRTVEEALGREGSAKSSLELMQPLRELADNDRFWNHTTEGLTILCAPGFFKMFQLQRPVPELAIVSDSFHIKPLLRILQTKDRYQVLSLSRQKIRLFEGNRDALDEVELGEGMPATITEALGAELTDSHLTVASYGGIGPGAQKVHAHGSRKEEREVDTERFMREVDRAIAEHYSKPSGLPLMLAAPPDLQSVFRELSHNPRLLPQGIDLDANALDNDELKEAAWKVMEPEYQTQIESVKEQFGASQAKGMGVSRLSEIASAAVQGRVATLMVEAERRVPGQLDRHTGSIARANGEPQNVDDLLDDLAELVLKMGGAVLSLSAAEIPSESGAAAILRSGARFMKVRLRAGRPTAG
ncbi:MAG: hypothetical protein U5J83_18990 [Bryobacterales bacterium]|nr:hypothetical protein [Bryobacterales bacterium]